mmetsp:Transcript_24999/g.69466  ORF Transcript_24999/g.69466 Transcript_24999/m.69466 type:complete len:152 (+) Transcript_24999:772-1227(+)
MHVYHTCEDGDDSRSIKRKRKYRRPFHFQLEQAEPKTNKHIKLKRKQSDTSASMQTTPTKHQRESWAITCAKATIRLHMHRSAHSPMHNQTKPTRQLTGERTTNEETVKSKTSCNAKRNTISRSYDYQTIIPHTKPTQGGLQQNAMETSVP